jgi:DeoR/GlpR family transcriptional regulator of sugar metabolism
MGMGMEGLNERQLTALEIAAERGEVRLADLREEHPFYCRDTYRKDLVALCEEGVLRKRGRTKGTRYVWGGASGGKRR